MYLRLQTERNASTVEREKKFITLRELGNTGEKIASVMMILYPMVVWYTPLQIIVPVMQNSAGRVPNQYCTHSYSLE